LPSISNILPSFAVLVLSLSFHEAAHAWTANRLGDPTARLLGRLTLNPLAHIDWIGTVLFPLIAMVSGLPLLGWAKPVPVNMQNLQSPRRDFGIVALAGPVSNLILAAGAIVAFVLVPASSQNGFFIRVLLFRAIELNVLLAVFNMLPVPPLDGGNVLMGIAPLPVAQAINRLRPYGFIILYGLIFLGVLDAIMVPIENTLARWLL
jgi:Zn-dependent protease